MWKKVLLSVTGLMLVVTLIAGAAATASADDGNRGIRGPFQGKFDDGNRDIRGPFQGKIIDRAAQILGIDKQKLIDAFKQAGSEVSKENMDARLARWVADGKLTQAQADQYKAWLAARPTGVPAIAGFDTARSMQLLDRLLENGRITQAQYDAYKAWLEQKPSFDLPKPKPERPFNAKPGNK